MTLKLAGNFIAFVPGIDPAHLQLVLDDGSSELEIEVQAPASITFGEWSYPSIPRNHADDDNTPGYGDPDKYKSTILNIGNRIDTEVWNILENIHYEFSSKGGDIDYDTDKNSNSYINTLMYMIGISLNLTIINSVTPPDADDGFPGKDTNVIIGDDAFAFDLQLTGGNDYIRTGIKNDTIDGLTGDDTVDAGDGDDYIKKAKGNSSISGGDGSDTVDFSSATESVIINWGSSDHNTIEGVEYFIGSSHNDVINSSGSGNTILGGYGNDTLKSVNHDALIIDAGIGYDWLDYSSLSGNDFVNIDMLSENTYLNLDDGEVPTGTPKDTFAGIEAIRGTNNGDVVYGDGLNNIIMGEGGNDSINAHTGDDEIQGGGGRDTLNGWIGSDVIYGESGNDSLFGDENDDVLIGGAGNDKLFGGKNSDIYWFSPTDGDDTIIDGHGADRILLYGDRFELSGEANLVLNPQGWTYVLLYGEDADNDNKGDFTAYLNWEGDSSIPGSRGDLEIDFDATYISDITIEDFANGEFGIQLEGGLVDLNVEEGESPADTFFNSIPHSFEEYSGEHGPEHSFVDPDDGEEESEEEVIVVHPWPDDDGNEDNDDYFPPIHIGTPSDGDGTWNPVYPDLPGNPVVPGDPLPTVPDPLDPGAASMGDPHLMTYDGKFYDFQDAGEFTLVRSTDANAPFTVQARQKSWDLGDAQGEMFSVNSAIATQLGDYKVGFYLPGSLPYDLAAAQADEFTLNDTLPVLYVGNYPVFMADNAIFTIDGAGSVYRQGDNYMVVNENLDYFTVTVHDTHIDFASGLSGTRTSGSVEGLLGNYDGDANNDFMLDDGTNLGTAIDNNTLYNTFGDDWRITQSESLFLYGEGQNTHSFDNFEFDNQHRTLADFDPAVVSAAQTAVTAEGFDPNSDVFDAAVLDYIVMGSIEYTNMWEALEDRTVIDADITNIATNLVEGTVNPDSLIGTAGVDRLAGYEGNDTIKGRADDDTLVGGVGDDLLYGEGGFDTFLHYVGDGSDTLYEDGNSFSAVAMIGVDMEDIYFNVSGDHLIATNTNNSESVTMMWQYDDIAAGLPFGTFNGQSLATSLTIRGTSATAGEVVNGSILADTLIGGLGDDIIYGNGGTNYFIHEVGDGNDHLYDEYNAQSVVTLNGVNQDDLYFNVDGDDLLITDIANDETIRLDRHYYKTDLYGFRFSSLNGEDISGGLLIRGTSDTAGEDLVDTEFNDTFEGGLGDDAMWADGGTNHYIHNAGDGNDTIFENRNAMSTVEMNAISADSIYFSVDGSTLVVTNIETGEFLTLRYQYYYSDSTYFSTINGIDVTGGITVKGTSATAAETIEGTSYNDTIIGGLGDDYIITEGQDTITHNIGDGNDLLVGNYGDEAVIEMVGVDAEDIEFYINGTNLQIIDTVNNEVVTLYAQYSYTYNGFRFGSVNGIDLTEGLTLNGDASDNTLNGSLMDEEFNAGAGNDVVYAEKGNDTVYGGTGNDYIFGEDDNDLIMGEDGDDTLRGDDENDTLWGGSGHDSLRGGNHDDVLYGEEGNDTLNGGNGVDIFVFGANSGVDLISDFDEGTDLLHFDSGVFATAADAVAAFSSGIIDLGSSNSVTLQGVSTLTEADIVIV